MNLLRSGRRRNRAAALAAAALALSGLTVLQAPQAQSAPGDISFSVAPTTVDPGADRTFTVTVGGGATYAEASSVRISLPTGISTASVVSETVPAGWDAVAVNPATGASRLDIFGSNANNDLGNQTITVVVNTAVAPRTGPADDGQRTWTLKPYRNQNFDGNGGATSLFNTASFTSSVSVTQVAQTITFPQPADRVFGVLPFDVSATGGASGNEVTFAASPAGVCTAEDLPDSAARITVVGAGDCTIVASQAAGAGYPAAAPVSRTFTVAKAPQTITFAPLVGKVYGESVALTASVDSPLAIGYTTEGPCEVDGTTLTLTGVGLCEVTAAQPGNANYLAAASVTRSFSITKATATVQLGGLSHVYDGNAKQATATTIPADLETVSIAYEQGGAPVDPTNAGSYLVTATLDNPNYEGSATNTLVIAQRPVTGSIVVDDKEYDGTATASIASTGLDDVVASDAGKVSLTCTGATFDGTDAGTRTATATGCTLTGPASANYTLTGVGTDQAEITRKAVTASVQAGDKTYDGTTTATVKTSLSGVLPDDQADVTVDVLSADFAQAGVGDPVAVTARVRLDGSAAGNYLLTGADDEGVATLATSAAIDKRWVLGSYTVATKVYDGTTVATIENPTLSAVPAVDPSGVVAGETLGLSVTGAAFADENVGAGKPVSRTLALTGATAANYLLANEAELNPTGTITARPVTGSFTAHDKIWDGTSVATLRTATLTNAIDGDAVALVVKAGTTLDFHNGSNKTSLVGTWDVKGTFELAGADAGNYSLTAAALTSSAKASITAKWNLTGFYAPVDMTVKGSAPVWNTVKAGSTVPLKFEVFEGIVEQTSTAIITTPSGATVPSVAVTKISCTTGSEDAVETVSNAGATALRYDATGGQFIQNWKTPAGAGSCYRVTVTTLDGATTTNATPAVTEAYFKTK